jgi:hypothetical protein
VSLLLPSVCNSIGKEAQGPKPRQDGEVGVLLRARGGMERWVFPGLEYDALSQLVRACPSLSEAVAIVSDVSEG